MKLFAVTSIILCLIILTCISTVIILKKKISYKYLQKDKQLSAFDSLTSYDGSWFFKTLDYTQIIFENPDEEKEILRSKKIIFQLQKLAIGLFICLITFGIVMKIMGII